MSRRVVYLTAGLHFFLFATGCSQEGADSSVLDAIDRSIVLESGEYAEAKGYKQTIVVRRNALGGPMVTLSWPVSAGVSSVVMRCETATSCSGRSASGVLHRLTEITGEGYRWTRASDGYSAVYRRTATQEESPKSNETRGTGGRSGFVEQRFRASNGKQSLYRLHAPIDAAGAKSHGLLVYLHGDTAPDYADESYWAPLKEVARARGLIPVSVLAPTTAPFGTTTGPTWWVDGDRNAVFLDELLKGEILAKYNVDKHKVYFTGQSGGPVFLSSPWIRHYAHQYRGGALIFCGGWTATNMEFRGDEEWKRHFFINIYVGKQDHNYEWSRSAASYYRSQGMKVRTEHPDIGHCQWTEPFAKLLGDRLDLQMSGRFTPN